MTEQPQKGFSIRLHRLALENFKCHRHLVLEFGGRDATIFGDNGAGKTSVYDALTWLLFGKDSAGNADPGLTVKPLGPEGQVVDHEAITAVEAELEVRGERVTLGRTLREVWTGKGGKRTFAGNTSCYYLDGAALRKSEFDAKVSALAPELPFRLMANVHAFAGELPWQERRAILFEMAHCPSEEALLGERPEFACLRDRGRLTLEEYRRKLLARRKALTQAGADLPPRMDECRRQLEALGQEDFAAARDRMAVLLARKEALEGAGSDHTQDIARHRQRQRALQSQLDRLEQQGRRIRRDQSQCRREELEELERVYVPGVCPACGQSLPREAREAFQRDREEKLQALARRKEALAAEAARLEDLAGTLEQNLQEIRRQILAWEQADPGPGRDREAWNRELEGCRETLAREALYRQLKGRLEELSAQARDNGQTLARTEEALSALERFYRYKAGVLEERVNSLFSLATFRLFREKVEGGLEERCDLVYRGIPWQGLNSAAKVNLGIDAINALGRFYGFTVPLFVDNAESVTCLEPANTQVIRLAVRPGAELRLE